MLSSHFKTNKKRWHLNKLQVSKSKIFFTISNHLEVKVEFTSGGVKGVCNVPMARRGFDNQRSNAVQVNTG